MLLETLSTGILNSDLSEIGCHWIAIIVQKHQVILFDSSAQDLYKSNNFIYRFLRVQNKPIVIPTFPIQPIDSNLCGLYA